MAKGRGATTGPQRREEITVRAMRAGSIPRSRRSRASWRVRIRGRAAAGRSRVRVAVSTVEARVAASRVEMERVAVAVAAPLSAPRKGLSMKGPPAANGPSGSMAFLLVLSYIAPGKEKVDPADWIDLSHACEVS